MTPFPGINADIVDNDGNSSATAKAAIRHHRTGGPA